MPTATYDLIAQQTVSSNTSSLSFSSIPQSYKDLVLVCYATSTSNSEQLWMRVNNDTNGVYNMVMAENASAIRLTNQNVFYLAYNQVNLRTEPCLIVINFIDYSVTNKHKHILSRSSAQASAVNMFAGRWANTSAITTINLVPSNPFTAGSTFYLYGIVS